MILGTAGHIDHGKTALIKALTGVDTDRLPEERRRGITIELGFAPLPVEGVGIVGVVDVPGHEAFVRTMLAGATGIDLALVVVAADEGVMPQTREHLAILSLLGVGRGVVALTKTDLIDDDWLELVGEDVTTALAHTTLAGAEMIPVSAHTGRGLDDLRAAIARAVAGVPGRDSTDIFRLPVDRSFTVKGTGTVVTGTVWSGSLRRDDVVRVLPGTSTARVRGMQSHGSALDAAGPGMRVAVNLAGVDVADVPRGSTLVTDATWGSARLLRADVELLADAPVIRPRARLRFHLGTRDVGARIVARGGSLAPGTPTPVRVVLDETITARGGDRFVLRTASPSATVGGGVVTDPLPQNKRSKPWTNAGEAPSGWLLAMAKEAGIRGIQLATLPVRIGLHPSEVKRTLVAIEPSTEVSRDVLYDRDAIQDASTRVLAAIDDHHARAPLEEGLSVQSLRAGLAASPELSEHLLEQLAAAGQIFIDHGLARRAGWVVRPSPSQQRALDELAAALRVAGREPPSVPELAATGLAATPDGVSTLLRLLERIGIVRQVEHDRFYSVDALEELTKALRSGMANGREYSPSELRELLGVSRKYLIPLLEYYDRVGITERRAQGRVLRGEGGEGRGGGE